MVVVRILLRIRDSSRTLRATRFIGVLLPAADDDEDDEELVK